MRLPKFIPYPKAWKQSIILILEFIPLIIFVKILNAIFFHNFTPQELERIFSDPVMVKFISRIGIIYLIPSIYWLSLANQFVFDKPYSKLPYLPRWRNFWAGIINFLVMLFSLIMALIFTFVLDQNNDFTEESVYLCLAIITTIISAYFFHLGNLLFQQYPKKESSQPIIDPIEQELNTIKSNLGLKKMKDVKKYESK